MKSKDEEKDSTTSQLHNVTYKLISERQSKRSKSHYAYYSITMPYIKIGGTTPLKIGAQLQECYAIQLFWSYGVNLVMYLIHFAQCILFW